MRFTLLLAMNVTFYILVGFLIGISVMCAMVIAVSVKDTQPAQNNDPKKPRDLSNRPAYRQDTTSHYTYNASGKKRKVVNVRYRD